MFNQLTKNNMNTFKCTVDNRWMWGLESACITINSPRGGYVRVDKWHVNKLTDTQYELVLKCVRSENNSNVVELTMDEMKELAVIGKIAGTVYIKKN